MKIVGLMAARKVSGFATRGIQLGIPPFNLCTKLMDTWHFSDNVWFAELWRPNA